MIEIRLIVEEENTEKDFTDFFASSLKLFRSVMKSCIDQNIILNCYSVNSNVAHDALFYAINLENANQFIQTFTDSDAVRISSDNGFTFSFSTTEINFDQVYNIDPPFNRWKSTIINNFDESCCNIFPLDPSAL